MAKPKASAPSAPSPASARELRMRKLGRNVTSRHAGDVMRSSQEWLDLLRDQSRKEQAAEALRQAAIEADPTKPGYEGNEIVAPVVRALSQLPQHRRQALLDAAAAGLREGAGSMDIFSRLPDKYDPLGDPSDLATTPLQEALEKMLAGDAPDPEDAAAAKAAEEAAREMAIEDMRTRPVTFADREYARTQEVDSRAPINRPLPEEVQGLPQGDPARVAAEQAAVQRIVGPKQFEEVQKALKKNKIPVLPPVARRTAAETKRLQSERGILAGASPRETRAVEKELESLEKRPVVEPPEVQDRMSLPTVKEGDEVLVAEGPQPPDSISGRGWREVVNVVPGQNLQPQKAASTGDTSAAASAIELVAGRLAQERRAVSTEYSQRLMKTRDERARSEIEAEAQRVDAEYQAKLQDRTYLTSLARQTMDDAHASLVETLAKSASDAEAAGDAEALADARHRLRVADAQAQERAASFDALTARAPASTEQPAPYAPEVSSTFIVLPHQKAAMDAGVTASEAAPIPKGSLPSQEVKQSGIARLKSQLEEGNRRRQAYNRNPSGPASAFTPRIAVIRKGTGGLQSKYKPGDGGYAKNVDAQLEQSARSEGDRVLEAIYRAALHHNADSGLAGTGPDSVSLDRPKEMAGAKLAEGMGLEQAVAKRRGGSVYDRAGDGSSQSSHLNTIDLSRFAPWAFSHLPRMNATGAFEWPTRAPSAEWIADQMIGRYGIENPDEFRATAIPVLEASLQEQAHLGPQTAAAIRAASTRLHPNMTKQANGYRFFSSPYGKAYQERMFHPTLEMRRLEPSIEAGRPGGMGKPEPAMPDLESVFAQAEADPTDWEAFMREAQSAPADTPPDWNEFFDQMLTEPDAPQSPPDTPPSGDEDLGWLFGMSGPPVNPLSMNRANRNALSGLIA